MVRIVYTPVSSSLPLFVADRRGYLKRDGLEVVLTRVESAAEAINLMIADNADIVIQQNMSGVFGAWITSPSKFKCFMPAIETDTENFDYILVQSNSSIKSAEDLRGKTVGLRQGPTDLLLGELYLRKHGLDPKQDVILLQMQSKQLLDALHSKHLDAAITVDPDATIALSKLRVAVLKRFYRGELLNPYPATCNLVRKQFLVKHASVFDHIVRGLKHAIDDIESDRSAAVDTMAFYTPIDPKLVGNVGIPVFTKDYAAHADGIRSVVRLYEEGGVIPRAPSLADLFIATPD